MEDFEQFLVSNAGLFLDVAREGLTYSVKVERWDNPIPRKSHGGQLFMQLALTTCDARKSSLTLRK